MIPEESRFHSDPDELVGALGELPPGWTVGTPDPDDLGDARRLTELLRDHERQGRGWPGGGKEDVAVHLHGLRTRENVVVRDEAGRIRAWGSVHDRASGRMLFVHVVERGLDEPVVQACSEVLVDWAEPLGVAVIAIDPLPQPSLEDLAERRPKLDLIRKTKPV